MGFLGREILGYTLTRKLGQGGVGVVYLGEHAGKGTLCVFKILDLVLGGDPELLARFRRRASGLHLLGHAAVPRVLNSGRLLEGELFYQVEHVAGVDLGSRLASAGPPELDRLCPTFEPVASALEAAHDIGLMHGGIKPGNILIDERRDGSSSVSLLDLGMLTTIDAMGSRAFVSRGAGALDFAAPEQLAEDDEVLDPRADVYALAATIYAAVAGASPFASRAEGAAATSRRSSAPPLRWVAPQAPRALEAALERCLENDPDKRPPTVAGAWGSIRDALESHGRAQSWVPAACSDPPRWRGRARWALYAGAFVIAALAGLAAAWFL